MDNQNNKSEKLSIVTKLGFAAGDIFGGGSLVVIGFYYLYFLTDVLLISPALAGVVFLISKGWDAISDPIMGIISDRTRSRFGRRRPYFLLGIVLIFCSFFMMWYPVDFEEEMQRFVYVIVAYLFFSTSYTIVMIPYFSLASELTVDYNERTSLTAYRMIFSMTSSLVAASVPLEIVKNFQNERDGYIVMAVVFGLLFSLPYLATFFLTKERKEFQKEPEPFNFNRTFIVPFKTPTFTNVLFMYLFAMTTMDIIMSMMMYFMTYYIGRPDETNYVLGTLLITQIIIIPIYGLISRKIGKKKSYLFSAIYWLVIMASSFLITSDNPAFVIYIFAFLIGLGSGGLVVTVYSILPDVPDVDELYSGKRREGIYSGLITFLRKLSSALGIFIVSNVIELAGYVKPVSQTVDGITTMVKQPQPEEFYFVLRIMFAVVPVLFLIIGIIFTVKYRLTPELHNRLKDFLNKRRVGEEVSQQIENELKDSLESKKAVI